MNEEFFKPHGLYCLIMTYNPDSSKSHEQVDITKTVATSTTKPASGMRQQFNNFRISSGETYGELELPEAAALIYPDLEAVASDRSAEGIKKQNMLKSSQKFIADYFDRRAQAEYAAKHPGSKLSGSGEEPQFSSRWADPNSKAYSGGLLTLATGGAYNPRERRMERRARRTGKRAERRGEEIPIQHERRQGRRRRERRGGVVRRVLKKVSVTRQSVILLANSPGCSLSNDRKLALR